MAQPEPQGTDVELNSELLFDSVGEYLQRAQHDVAGACEPQPIEAPCAEETDSMNKHSEKELSVKEQLEDRRLPTVSKAAVAVSEVSAVAADSGERPVARKLLSCYGLHEATVHVKADAVKSLHQATFQDTRWPLALSHLQDSEHWAEAGHVEQLIRKGAKSFGFWHLPDEVVEVLAVHLLDKPTAVSPALQSWKRGVGHGASLCRDSAALGSRAHVGPSEDAIVRAPADGTAAVAMGHETRWTKTVMLMFVFLLSNVYALEVVLIMYPGIVEIFGLPIYVARAGGIGTLLWTALLFLSMSRTFFRAIGSFLPFGWIIRCIDQHKELHIFCGQMMVASAGLHVFSHCVGTVPGLISHSLDELNSVLGCANPDSTPGYLGVRVSWLQMPHCPLTSRTTYMGALFTSTPGLTGIALVLLSALVAYTANEVRRKTNFELFYYVHNAAMPLWLLLLFVHGSNGWVGVGFPLVVFVCSLPVALYSVDRVLRLLRYYLFAGKAVRIVDVVIRPGAGNGAKGALINLMLSKPPYLWRFSEGMYAFLNMPGYASGQWHPFTISSSKADCTVDFIINGVGDWTCALAQQCLDAHAGRGELPVVAIDGPYLAPTATALSQEVLVAVGAGVGITPFLSLMSTIIAVLGDEKKAKRLPFKEAHFYWMTRSADEFLFGRRHFTKIVSNPNLRDKVFLHLHVTQREPEKDVAAFLFREAVRRQSRIDLKEFRQIASVLPVTDMIVGAQLPWCWQNGAKDDLLWVRAVLECADDSGQQIVAAAHKGHWASGLASSSRQSFAEQPVAAQGGALPGLFARSSCSTLPIQSCALPVDCLPAPSAFLPVAFGRPDFGREMRAIGEARPGDDVHVYVCGNDGLVQSLQQVCASCTAQAKDSSKVDSRRAQKYIVHYERFG